MSATGSAKECALAISSRTRAKSPFGLPRNPRGQPGRRTRQFAARGGPGRRGSALRAERIRQFAEEVGPGRRGSALPADRRPGQVTACRQPGPRRSARSRARTGQEQKVQEAAPSDCHEIQGANLDGELASLRQEEGPGSALRVTNHPGRSLLADNKVREAGGSRSRPGQLCRVSREHAARNLPFSRPRTIHSPSNSLHSLDAGLPLLWSPQSTFWKTHDSALSSTEAHLNPAEPNCGSADAQRQVEH